MHAAARRHRQRIQEQLTGIAASAKPVPRCGGVGSSAACQIRNESAAGRLWGGVQSMKAGAAMVSKRTALSALRIEHSAVRRGSRTVRADVRSADLARAIIALREGGAT